MQDLVDLKIGDKRTGLRMKIKHFFQVLPIFVVVIVYLYFFFIGAMYEFTGDAPRLFGE